MLGHPSLTAAYAEELAGVEFRNRKLGSFRDILLASAVADSQSPQALAEALAAAGQGAERERILALAAAMPNWWCVRAGSSSRDAEHVLRQSLALHRRTGELNRELALAEKLLAEEPNEQNFARLLDIKTHLADLANAEAAIDGFGDDSGREPAPI